MVDLSGAARWWCALASWEAHDVWDWHASPGGASDLPRLSVPISAIRRQAEVGLSVPNGTDARLHGSVERMLALFNELDISWAALNWTGYSPGQRLDLLRVVDDQGTISGISCSPSMLTFLIWLTSTCPDPRQTCRRLNPGFPGSGTGAEPSAVTGRRGRVSA